MAVDDDLIRKNPFGFELASVIVNEFCYQRSDHPEARAGVAEIYQRRYAFQQILRCNLHSLRAKSGMSPKTLQYIMGHSDISVTLSTYTQVQFDDAKAGLLWVAEV